MNYLNWAKRNIAVKIEQGYQKFIIYPFGEKGAIVKSVLNVFFGIEEEGIVDNYLSECYDAIMSLEDLRNIDLTDMLILVCSDHVGIYQELREALYEIVSPINCFEVFPAPDELQLKAINERNRKAYIKAKEVLLLDKGMVYTPQKTNSTFFLPYFSVDLIQRHIFLSDTYFESQHLDRLCKEFGLKEIIKDRSVIDIGANIGNHSLFFMNECAAKKVYAFEPAENTRMILEQNIAINNLEEKIEVFSYGLGNQVVKAKLGKYDLGNIGGTWLVEDIEGELEIKRLDDFSFDEMALIKIDVEGMELQVLEGAIQTLEKYQPCVLIEINVNNYEKVYQLMKKLGYKCVVLGVIDYFFYK